MIEDIKKLQAYLIENSIDGYLIFTNDDHGSEYVVDYYKTREYFSCFTGSNGTMLILKDKSYLWTDGRYFIQAAAQLKLSNTILMKENTEGYPSIYEFIKDNCKSIAFDFATATTSFVNKLKETVAGIQLIDEKEIINLIWENRPQIQKSKAYMLDDSIAGESIKSKLNKVIFSIKKQGCKYGLLASLDDIAWLYNMRGNDIQYNPVNYAYSLISENNITLYIDNEKLNIDIIDTLHKQNVLVKPYNMVFSDIEAICDPILIDASATNYALCNKIKNCKSIYPYPTTFLKALKNDIELQNIRDAHIIDAVAMIKFMRYLKENVGKTYMDELSLGDKLLEFRKQSPKFLDLSFDTICAYQSNGAIVHYEANKETNKEVKAEGLLLVDSGAQYKYGTTDITRTFALGKVTDKMKKHFTLALKSHITLSKQIFNSNTTGLMLDQIARKPLQDNGLDFNHGTGHGVGYLLNVHEGPQTISKRGASVCFHERMVTSIEPGIYIEGEYGIRHENLCECLLTPNNELVFSPLTLVPFDIDGIDTNLLNDDEILWLNNYHSTVYNRISKYLCEDDRLYLESITKPLVK